MGRREKNGEMKKTGSVNGTPLSDQLLERISQRAYKLYELRGGAGKRGSGDRIQGEGLMQQTVWR